MTFGRKDRADAGVGGGSLGATLRPSLQVVDGIDDTATEFAVGRTGPVGAVLFEGSGGKAEKARRLGRSQIARRDAGGGCGHDRASVILVGAAGYRRSVRVTVAEKKGRGECEDLKVHSHPDDH